MMMMRWKFQSVFSIQSAALVVIQGHPVKLQFHKTENRRRTFWSIKKVSFSLPWWEKSESSRRTL